MSHKCLYNSLKEIIRGMNFKDTGIKIKQSIRVRLFRVINLLSHSKDLRLHLEELVQATTLYRSKMGKTTEWATNKTRASQVEKQKSVRFQGTIELAGPTLLSLLKISNHSQTTKQMQSIKEIVTTTVTMHLMKSFSINLNKHH